jgi:23S rRNA (cytidine1920-2'-O)/16S rRNA (cytidine1409-2'-O)-methyltransferase
MGKTVPRRRLDLELVRRKLVPSRQAARDALDGGRVRVDGIAVPKPSSLVAESSAVSLVSPPARFVSRGGDKLEGALSTFGVSVAGRRAVDVGASTGGFTDCLLQRGAASVVALDVGYGQLHWSLRGDDRVTVVERVNIKDADPAAIGAPFDLVVADLSFISLARVAAQLAALAEDAGDLVVLVKPQFEAGKGSVGKGGVVRDPAVHRRCIEAVIAAMSAAGYPAVAVVASPLLGPAGNREFFLWCSRSGHGISPERMDEVVAA